MAKKELAPGKDVSRLMKEARSGQVTADLEAWAGKLETFIERQPEVKGKVVVEDLERPATGTAGGNAQFAAKLDLGRGPLTRRFLIRYQPPKGVFHDYDIPGLFNVHRALQGTGIPAPKPLWLDATGEFMGVPAFIMDFVEGAVPLQSYFSEGPIAEATPSHRETMISNVIETVARIHAVDWRRRGLEFLRDRGRGATLVERDISWYWDFLECTLPDQVGKFTPVRKWLLENQPAIKEPVLNHGDCQLGNYMFRGPDVAAVLDWEMACLGAREMDLAYLKLANEYVSVGLEERPEGVPPDEDWLAEYERVSGYKIQEWDYYRTMMLYRFAMIFTCGSSRVFPEDQLEAARPAWGWFEDTLMEETKHLIRQPPLG